MKVEIREYDEIHRAWARDLLKERWGSHVVITRGRAHEADTLPGFVAIVQGAPRGLVTYRCADGECEIVTLDSLLKGSGIGTALLNAVREGAELRGCPRIWLVTTNDNTEALRFYQKRGFELVAVHRNAIQESRKLKPEIPPHGMDGIPIRDEVELEIRLQPLA